MHTHHQPTDDPMQACLEACLDCYRSCTTLVTHCLSMGGHHASPAHITTLLDCADLCQTSANVLLRGSPFHPQTCAVCAAACIRCADECEQMADGDTQMLACAAVCRACATHCQQMAQMTA